MWDIICIFMPFLKTFQWEFCKSPSQISMPYVKVGSTKILNRCDLSSQDVTPTTASISYGAHHGFHTLAFYLMVQSGHVSWNQSRGIYIHGLSWSGPCVGKRPLGSISFCRPKIKILVLERFTSRLEKVQNLDSLFRSLCTPTLDLERGTH